MERAVAPRLLRLSTCSYVYIPFGLFVNRLAIEYLQIWLLEDEVEEEELPCPSTSNSSDSGKERSCLDPLPSHLRCSQHLVTKVIIILLTIFEIEFLHPFIENKPLPLISDVEQEYLLVVHKDFNDRMKNSPFYLKPSFHKIVNEHFSDR